MVRLLEPMGSCRRSLWRNLSEGTYRKPFIVDSRSRRCLHFDLEVVQSAMSLEHPDRLCLAYTRKMMAFLLFKRTPARILLLGLGGGSLAKFCCRSLPDSAITAIESNSDVISLRGEFGIPPDDSRFQVIRSDGAAYVAALPPCNDIILADACDRSGVAPELNVIDFYRDARNSLSSGGIFVANICGDKHTRAAHILKIRNAFDDQCFTLRVTADGNVIMFAFKDAAPAPGDWPELHATALELKTRVGLDFPRYARSIAQQLARTKS